MPSPLVGYLISGDFYVILDLRYFHYIGNLLQFL